jgi:catechol 2,3-dioxygenase-like lactoylglutathione lyase family enzyme
MSATGTAASGGMSLTVLMIVNNQDRSRDFYHHVIGAEIVRDRDPAILRFHNGVIVLNVGGGPTGDKPTVTMAPPANPDTVSMALNIRVADIHAVYHAWRARGAQFLTPPQDRDAGQPDWAPPPSRSAAPLPAGISAGGCHPRAQRLPRAATTGDHATVSYQI